MRRVNPEVYTASYYLTDCTGYQEYRRSWGAVLEPRLARMVSHIPLQPAAAVLDIGCGRGELVFWAARRQAAQAIGLDYSSAAIALANKARAHFPQSIRARTKFLHHDAKRLPFPAHKFDAVFMTEVLEHLYPAEQDLVFKEIARVLKPGGFLFVHTSPSRVFQDYTYPLYCYPLGRLIVNIWNTFTSRRYPHLGAPQSLRTSSHRVMHVAEPDYFSLRRLFSRHEFRGRIRSTNVTIAKPILGPKDSLFNFLVYLVPISNFPPVNILFGNDFYAILRR